MAIGSHSVHSTTAAPVAPKRPTAPYPAELQHTAAAAAATTGPPPSTATLPPARPTSSIDLPTNQAAPSNRSHSSGPQVRPAPRTLGELSLLRLCPRRVLHASLPLCSCLSLCARVLAYQLRVRVCVCGSGTLHFSCCWLPHCCLLSLLPPRRRRPPQLLSAPCRLELPFRPPSQSPT